MERERGKNRLMDKRMDNALFFLLFIFLNENNSYATTMQFKLRLQRNMEQQVKVRMNWGGRGLETSIATSSLELMKDVAS